MSLDYLNPMANLYNEFLKILDNVVIKYTSKAIAGETEAERIDAEAYIDAVDKTDNFDTYAGFSDEELVAVGIYDYNMRKKCVEDKTNIPYDTYDSETGEGTRFRQDLVELRRKEIIENYVEKNNYYRLLNGLPDLNTNPEFFEYVPGNIAVQCGIPLEDLVLDTPLYKESDLDSLFPDTHEDVLEEFEVNEDESEFIMFIESLYKYGDVEYAYKYALIDGKIIPVKDLYPEYAGKTVKIIKAGLNLNVTNSVYPVHEIQDHYNNLDPEFPDRGDQIMSKLEGIGFIEKLKKNPKLFGISINPETGEEIEDPNKVLIYGGALSGPAVALTDKAKRRISNNSGIKKFSNVIRLSDDTNPITGYADNINIYYSVSIATTFAGINLIPGDYIMSTGIGWEKVSIQEKKLNGINRDYLNFLGSRRIPITKARKAKNFSILQLDKNIVNTNIYEAFIEIYEQCRDYMTVVVYQYSFSEFIAYYDNFIAMCIMLMAEMHLIVQQIPFEIRRNFFDPYAIRMLYEAYDMPYDIYVDIETQNIIAKNLNLIILHKATDKVLYDVSHLLGFKNIQIYKYYLAKQHRFDPWGNPVFSTKEEFNNDTGKLETVDDYDMMYDIYFQKEELREKDFIRTFNTSVNKVEYSSITAGDPYWWEDQHVIDLKNTAEYNFVESKYLGLTMSYKMTEVMFENIILLKALLYHKNELREISVNLSRIMSGASVSIFDAVILLLAMMCSVHRLKGEIITVPSDVVNVLDYLNNMDARNRVGVYDSFAFDFDFFKKDENGHSESDALVERVKRALSKRVKGYIVDVDIETKKEKILNYYNSINMTPPDINDIDVVENVYSQIVKHNYYVYDNPPYYTLYSGSIKTYKRNTYGNADTKQVVPDNFKNFDPETMVHKSEVRKDIFDIRLYEYVSENKETVIQRNISAFEVENMLKRGELKEIEIDHHNVDVDIFEKYLSVLSFTNESTRAEKIETFNLIYRNIRNLYEFINAKMVDEDDHERYEALKAFYKAAFYAKEMRNVFQISYVDRNTHKIKYRTAKNIFEYLYYANTALYSTIFTVDLDAEFTKFMSERSFPTYIRSYIPTDANPDDYPNSILVVDDGDVPSNNDINVTRKIAYSKVIEHIPSIRVGERVELYELPNTANSEQELKELFLSKVDDGLIDISYDTLKNTTSGENKNNSYMSSLLYFYINHIIFELKRVIANVNFDHLLNNTATLLQELLIKFIEYAKSFTVDFVGLDILFICDFKPENYLRMIDEVSYIEKTIIPRETMNFSFYDRMYTYDSMYANEQLRMNDRIAEPWFTDPDNVTTMPSKRNIVGWYDLSSPITLVTGVNYINTVQTSQLVDSPASGLTLAANVPSISNDHFFNLRYENTDYLTNGNKYKGLIPTFSVDSHSIIPDSYSYTIYMVCRATDIADVIGFPVAIENVARFHSEYGDIIGASEYREGPSVRFLNTPLVDIYTGVGSTNMCIREYVPLNSRVQRGNYFIDIITNKDAREWHVVALSQSKNTVRVYIDGERCLDHTFSENGAFNDGDTADFNVAIMPNKNLGQGFPDVKDGFSYYLCDMQFLMVAIASVNHNSAELKENSKWIAKRYGVDITHNIPRP